MRIQWNEPMNHLWTWWRGLSTDTESVSALIMDLSTSRTAVINFCLYTTQFMLFCYSSPNGLRQHKQELKIKSGKIRHFNHLICSWSQDDITKCKTGTNQTDACLGQTTSEITLLIPHASLCPCRLSAWLFFQLLFLNGSPL